jgi:hemerythrin-like domain-containing protein
LLTGVNQPRSGVCDGAGIMKPTEILSCEHRVIEQVLDCLERIIASANKTGHLDDADATAALDFFRTFADKCHHGKEETHLFPAMEAKGFSPTQGPTAVMRSEHVMGRECIQAMSDATSGAGRGDEAALRQFSEAGQRYIGLLRQHIQKEDHCLFSMADQAFSEKDQAELLEKFETVEAEEMGAGTHEKFLDVAKSLAGKYGVAERSAATAGHCCHH